MSKWVITAQFTYGSLNGDTRRLEELLPEYLVPIRHRVAFGMTTDPSKPTIIMKECYRLDSHVKDEYLKRIVAEYIFSGIKDE